MARIPDEEVSRLKSGVDLAGLVRSKGIELKPHGGKDLIGHCPFHEDSSPSFVVSPDKNLFHCLGCGAGGSVIDFVMKHDGVSFRYAVELLRECLGHPRKEPPPKLERPVSLEAGDQELMKQVLAYYRKRLKKTPAALDYLKSRCISPEAVETFGIGFADRTLGLRLPSKQYKAGGLIRSQLIKLGLYRESGHEHFNGCVVFPIRSASGTITEVYGRKIMVQKSGLKHLYLPGPHRGLLNAAAYAEEELILCESVIDALSFWSVGLHHVDCIWGTEGFGEDHLEAIGKGSVKRVYLAYDADPAGNRAAEREASRLGSMGLECLRVGFPPKQDANSYARNAKDPGQALREILSQAKEQVGIPEASKTEVRTGTFSTSTLAANKAANEGKDSGETPEPANEQDGATKDAVRQHEDGAPKACPKGEENRVPSGRDDEQKTAKEKTAGNAKVTGDQVELAYGPRQYRVRGLERNAGLETLKVTLRVLHETCFHIDQLDLYQAKQRRAFIEAASEETGVDAGVLKRELGKLTLELEHLREEALLKAKEEADGVPPMNEAQRAAALELLRDPQLLQRILRDFAACGVVGEATNLLAGYLAAVSRKLDRPLAIVIQSTSAAGKSSLMEAVLAMMPEEERVKYSAMTGQSLYYLGETNLKHKILAIVEEEGAEKAGYALKLLQSEGELTIASTGKDANGRLKTEEYHVEGPVMIFLTTTAIDIDEELLNRCLVLSVDESREQTRAIHALQREAETFAGLKRKQERERILEVHRNAQRLLEPLPVVNPFARQLTFLSDRTRTRRDHVKYLTLIRSITLLHQYQRPLKEKDSLQYIEVTREDIAAANRLAHEVLGRSLDELPPQTRRLLGLLRELIAQLCEQNALEQEDCLFTRRQVRAFTGWSNTQLKVHLDRLEDLEYILPHRGMRGSAYEYELLFDGNPQSEKPQLIGLIDTQTLSYDAEFTGSKAEFTAPKRGQNGGFTKSPLAAKASKQAASKPKGSKSAKRTMPPAKNKASS